VLSQKITEDRRPGSWHVGVPIRPPTCNSQLKLVEIHICEARSGEGPLDEALLLLRSPDLTLPVSFQTRFYSCHFFYSASAMSSRKRQAWGIRQALCSLFPHPTKCIPHPTMLACRRAGRWTQAAKHQVSSVCRTMVHSARTPTTRPLPRPAAIASRHATSRAMQVTWALLLSQAAPAALFSPHSPCLSLSFMQAHMQGPTLPQPEGREREARPTRKEARVDDASLRCHHQGLAAYAGHPLPPCQEPSCSAVAWPHETANRRRLEQGGGQRHMHTLGGGACGLQQGKQRHRGRTGGAWRGRGGPRARRGGEGQAVMSGPSRAPTIEAGLEASMAHVCQDAASGWSLGPDMTCLPSLR
jgi:hypothetical protein